MSELEIVVDEEAETLRVSERYHVARARIAAMARARAAGLGWTTACLYATSVSELAWNLVLHTDRGGNVTLASFRHNGTFGVQVTAADDGPGIPDVARALEDGFTTARGLGGGLSGVKRMMDEFEIVSAVGLGTRVRARLRRPCR
jgi:serine/threonine-protein kinase RsbT